MAKTLKGSRRDSIKDLSKIILNAGDILAEVKEKKSNILIVKDMNESPNPTDETFDYAVVIAKGVGVEDLELGDYIIDFTNASGFHIKNKPYLIIHRMSVNIAVRPGNLILKEDLTS